METRVIASCLVLTLWMALIGSAAGAQEQPVNQSSVYPSNSVVFHATYGDWSAAWQQWADSMPASDHPLFDTTTPGTNGCERGQSGPVWFLGGKYCRYDDPSCPSGTATRSCTVPAGRALYFPIINFGCLNVEAAKGFCGDTGPFLATMRASIGGINDGAADFQVTVDGKIIQADWAKKFRVQSPAYAATLPDDNILKAVGEAIEAGTYWGVDDGIYVMLKPLSAGQHTLNFKGSIPQFNFNLDITYILTIQ